MLDQEKILATTPGLRLQAWHKGQKALTYECGDAFQYYDLASLTKIICTVPALMWAYENKGLKLDSQVSYYLGDLPWGKDVCITDLLTHSSGLIAWEPFYYSVGLDAKKDLQDFLKNQKAGSKSNSVEKSVYSDLGFLTLGWILEKIFSDSLENIFNLLKKSFGFSSTLRFHPGNQCPENLDLYAPTEVCSWRAKLIQGEVHDENAWVLGGVAPHAGLFGSLEDVVGYGLWLRDVYRGQEWGIRPETLRLFARRATSKGDWGLGFMLPTVGSASCGRYFALDSFGHTGFTGTSLWYDHHVDFLVVILSNRVFNGRLKKDFTHLRPYLHEKAFEMVKGNYKGKS